MIGTTDSAEPAPLWVPSPERIERAGITAYLRWLAVERGLHFDTYDALWRWSVTELEAFWASVWDFCGVISHTPPDADGRRYRQVLEERRMPGARWFTGARVNYAEHCLEHAGRPGNATRVMMVCESEATGRREVTGAQLCASVGALTATLARLGVGEGDRVVSFLPNIPEAMFGVLAATSLGALWSSTSPDMGPAGVLDRFRQIEPTVLLAVDGYRYGGKDFDRRAVVAELVRGLPSLRAVIFVPHLDRSATLALDDGAPTVITIAEALATPAAPVFTPLEFDAPLWIVYSSGTTGMPKPIVHGHGGAIVESRKSMRLHSDFDERDRFFWFSSTSWIMWNFQVSALMSGATVLMFDGHPAHPDPMTLFAFAARERATLIGVSPAFLSQAAKAGISPAASLDLSAVRTVGVTGSPLTEEGFRWVYQHVGRDLMLYCISGGTDPGAAFLGGCPILPVWPGEMSCRMLGCAVYAFDDAGRERIDEVGELVVTEPMPSMPQRFWGDHDGRRYHDSYFVEYPGKWRHGDWLRITPRGSAIVYGRSDSTINRHGIRMGSSELYRVVEAFDEVADSLVVDLEYLGRPSLMALFVVPRPGVEVDDSLQRRLQAAIRSQLSGRHVPDLVVGIPDVPRTLSGKKLEVPVKRILLGHPVDQAVNRASMANPASIDWFIDFAARRATAG